MAQWHRYKRWTDVDGKALHVSRFASGVAVLSSSSGHHVLLKRYQIEELIEYLKGESE